MTKFSPARIAELFAASDAATTTDEKGRTLEEVVVHTLESIPGVGIVSRRRVNEAGSEEIDIGVLNRQHVEGLALFEAWFFVECKNWAAPVGAAALRDFEGKLRSRGRTFGILVAANGITGQNDQIRAANEVVARALAERIEIIVLTRDQLLRLRSPSDIVELLLERRTALIMAQTVTDAGWEPAFEHDGERPGEPTERAALGTIDDVICQEREHRVREMIARAPALPANELAAAEVMVEASNALDTSRTRAAVSEDIADWNAMLDDLIELGATAISFIERARGAMPQVEPLVDRALARAPNVRHVSITSRLFADFAEYYALEVTNAEEMTSDDAATALVGLVMETHWRVSDQIREARTEA